ncbi:MAG: sensor histidine kinase, partial [Fidelibacterota bacterium]
ENVPPVVANFSGLHEVLLNIVINAIEAMPEGGTLTVGTKLENENVIIYVSDTGIGMNEVTSERIFDPFFTTKEENGSGIGLSVAGELLRKMGGEITVDSKLGEGTTFTIKLPGISTINLL